MLVLTSLDLVCLFAWLTCERGKVRVHNRCGLFSRGLSIYFNNTQFSRWTKEFLALFQKYVWCLNHTRVISSLHVFLLHAFTWPNLFENEAKKDSYISRRVYCGVFLVASGEWISWHSMASAFLSTMNTDCNLSLDWISYMRDSICVHF